MWLLILPGKYLNNVCVTYVNLFCDITIFFHRMPCLFSVVKQLNNNLFIPSNTSGFRALFRIHTTALGIGNQNVFERALHFGPSSVKKTTLFHSASGSRSNSENTENYLVYFDQSAWNENRLCLWIYNMYAALLAISINFQMTITFLALVHAVRLWGNSHWLSSDYKIFKMAAFFSVASMNEENGKFKQGSV